MLTTFIVFFTVLTLAQANPEKFDFVVIGAGTGGSALAARLSENKKWSVLLLESGGETPPESLIPLNQDRVPRECGNSFGYVYEKDPNVCLAMNNQQCILPVGKGLGGQGIIGDMMYNRGNPQDYDNWCKQKNHGWCANDVLPFYLKMENTTFPCKKYECCGHGGPVSVSYVSYRTPLADVFLKAGHKLGYRTVNYNQKYMTGFALAQTTIKNGLRQNSYDAYIRPVIKERPNLTVRTNTQIVKLVITQDGDKDCKPRVTGVVYRTYGFTSTVMVDREVILSASPVGSAQILMLSGIGPADHLKSLGINVVKDLNVGFNYHDIIAIGGLTFTSDIPVNDMQNTFTPKALENFEKTRTGPASSPSIEAMAWLETSRHLKNYPDVEVALRAGSLVSQPMLNPYYNVNQTIFMQHFADIMDQQAKSFALLVSVQRPKSRGRVMLRSANPNDPAVIQGNFYSDPQDMKVAIKGIRMAISLMKTAPFKKINAKFYAKPFAPCADYHYGCDDYWECFARHFTFPLERWAGTTKMGPSCDPSAVVDENLLVYGIENLRVTGPAIAPQQITGHTDSVKTMIAEKLAYMIKKYHYWMDKKRGHQAA